MADSALARMDDLPVTIASLGLLYCKTDGKHISILKYLLFRRFCIDSM